MPLLELLVAGTMFAAGVASPASTAYVSVVYQNTPGLSCRVISLAGVYAGPSRASRYLGRTQNFIAVTGPRVDGFFPIITGRRIRGWVAGDEVRADHGSGSDGPCWVQQAPDGRLLFGWSQPGQS